MDFKQQPLSALLQDRDIFAVFDEEFHRATWLDVTALLSSESTLLDLYADGTVPKSVLDEIVKRIEVRSYEDK